MVFIFSLRNRVESSVTWEGLILELLLLYMKRSQEASWSDA